MQLISSGIFVDVWVKRGRGPKYLLLFASAFLIMAGEGVTSILLFHGIDVSRHVSGLDTIAFPFLTSVLIMLGSAIITALVLVVAYIYFRPKLRVESERADDMIFNRLQEVVRQSDEKIARLDKQIEELNVSMAKLRIERDEQQIALNYEREQRQHYERRHMGEMSKVKQLEKKVKEQDQELAKLVAKDNEQAEQIKKLHEDNRRLDQQNKILASHIGTDELRDLGLD